MTTEISMPDRSDWLAYLQATDCLIAPADAVAVANQSIDFTAAPGAEIDQFSRRFTAYFVLVGMEAEREIKQILLKAGLTAGMRVLDVGCGSGVNGHYMLDLGAAEVVGLDFAEPTLKIAQELPRLPAYDGRLHFQQHNMKQPLPFADNEFDAVLVANGEIPFYRETALAEYRRVLRPGGRIIFTMIEPRKRYAWNSLLDQLMGYAFCLNLKGYWGEEAITNQAREGYDSTYHQARVQLGMRFWSVPVDRVYPVTAVCEQAIQQHFALITGPIFKKQIGIGPEWETLCRLHDPASSDYIFKRPELYIADVIEVGAVVIHKETYHE